MSSQPLFVAFGNHETRLFFEHLAEGGTDYIEELVGYAENRIGPDGAGAEPPELAEALAELLEEELGRDVERATQNAPDLDGSLAGEFLSAALGRVDFDEVAEAALRLCGRWPAEGPGAEPGGPAE